MADEQTTQGAALEGAPAPSQEAVATEAVTPPQPDLSKLDLSTLPQFREYDSKLQKRLAQAERQAQDAETKLRQVDLERMTASLKAEGLDDAAIARSTESVRKQIEDLEMRRLQLLADGVQAKGRAAGLTDEQITRVPLGRTPEEYERAMDLAVAAHSAERQKRELEAELAKRDKAAAEAAQANRRESGAERLAGGEPEPHVSEQEQMRKDYESELKVSRSAHQTREIRQKYRLRGLNL